MSILGDALRDRVATEQVEPDPSYQGASAREWLKENSLHWNESSIGFRSSLMSGGTPLSPEVERPLTISTVFRGVSVVSNAIGRMPVRVRQRIESGGYKVQEKHRMARLLQRPE